MFRFELARLLWHSSVSAIVGVIRHLQVCTVCLVWLLFSHSLFHVFVSQQRGRLFEFLCPFCDSLFRIVFASFCEVFFGFVCCFVQRLLVSIVFLTVLGCACLCSFVCRCLVGRPFGLTCASAFFFGQVGCWCVFSTLFL